MFGLTSSDLASPRLATEAAFNDRLEPGGGRPIALALSGGGDSLALLSLASQWAAAHDRPLTALTVDHGLTPQSAAWTDFAGRAARRAGAGWRALTWTGPKPLNGLPDAARTARHTLLADATRSLGASVMLFAHTADDIAEGERMRDHEGSTLGRLSPWSPSPVWPEGRDVFVLRPFLGVRRETLRGYLTDQSMRWIEDPANADPRYARARARAALADIAQSPPPPPPPPLCEAARPLLERLQVSQDGAFRVERGDWPDDPSVMRRFLAVAIACVSGAAVPARGGPLDRLLSLCRTVDLFVATLGGARISADRRHLSIAREAGEFARRPPAAVLATPGADAVWDGRFEIRADVDIQVTAARGHLARLCRSDRSALAALPPFIRPTMPALMVDGEVRLPRPWGSGPALANPLSGRRFLAACGLITHERQISNDHMAKGPQSSYVEVLALA